MKKNFVEPEMEVVHFNAELVIATSGGLCGADFPCDTDIEAGVECRCVHKV